MSFRFVWTHPRLHFHRRRLFSSSFYFFNILILIIICYFPQSTVIQPHFQMDTLFLKASSNISDILDSSKVPGSSVYTASNGTDLGMQAVFAISFFAVFILLFSVLRLRWPYIFSPRIRLTITAPPYLSRKFFGWIMATIKTPETHILNTLGLDAVMFLRFYKMCMRLLLDIAFFSIVILWPINIHWSKVNLNPDTSSLPRQPSSGGDNSSSSGGIVGDPDNDGLNIKLTYSVTDYLFNLTLNTSDPKQKWNLLPHIVFVYIFSGLAYYHISKFSSRWASLRWHFLMQSRHALVSRTVMFTEVPRHLARSPRELEWFWGPGLDLGKIERVRVCPFNTKLSSSARTRSNCLVKLEHAYMQLLGNPCEHPDYDPQRLLELAMNPSESARATERALLTKWAKPSRRRKRKPKVEDAAVVSNGHDDDDNLNSSQPETDVTAATTTTISQNAALPSHRLDEKPEQDGAGIEWEVKRPTKRVRSKLGMWPLWKKVDAIDYWREKFLTADDEFRQLRKKLAQGEDDDCGQSTTAFVTFEDAASAHMAIQMACYPNPGYMKAKLAPEPRGVYWPNIWISYRRKWAGLVAKWVFIFVIWAFWSVPVILASLLLSTSSLYKIAPGVLNSDHNLLRSFLSSTIPSVFLLLFLNMLPWILKQAHFITGERTKPSIDYSVMTKMWGFLVFNVILVFGLSGTFWSQILDVVNNPGGVMQNLATNIPKVGTFFTGYILVLGVGYQPFKLLQLRPVIWHIGRQWFCNTPRDYARLVSPVYIDWYSVYPYPLLVFTIAMIYSTFSPPVVVAAVIYFVIGYPVMKYLLLYVYFRPFETAGMAWPKVCRRMFLAIILYQVVLLTFVIVKGGGWYTFSMVPIIALYLWSFYYIGWSLEKQGTVLPLYLWRNPPPNSSYPLPPEGANTSAGYGKGYDGLSLSCSRSIPVFDGKQSAEFKKPSLVQLEREAARAAASIPSSPAAPMLPPNSLSSYASQFFYRHRHNGSSNNGPPMSPEVYPLSGSSTWRSVFNNKSARVGKKPSFPSPLSATSRRSPSRSLLKGTKRTTPRQHQRESSCSVRTREIIISGSGKRHHARKKHLRPQQGDMHTTKVMKGKRYKSLAEAATIQGSRLIKTLGKLPAELYTRRIESHRNSLTNISDIMDAAMSLERDNKVVAKDGPKTAPVSPVARLNKSPQVHLHSPLSKEVPIRSRRRLKPSQGQPPKAVTSPINNSTSGLRKLPSWVNTVSNTSSNQEDNGNGEWVDMDDTKGKGKGKEKVTDADSVMGYPWNNSQEYLKPSSMSTSSSSQSRPTSADTNLNRSRSATTGLEGSSDLRRRQPYQFEQNQFADSSSNSSSAVANNSNISLTGGLNPLHPMSAAAESRVALSIIEAERNHTTDDGIERGKLAALALSMQTHVKRIRDYFLADFRPAGPILDLTYDRLYTQGTEEPRGNNTRGQRGGETARIEEGNVLSPLRHVLDKIVRRSPSPPEETSGNQDTLLPTAQPKTGTESVDNRFMRQQQRSSTMPPIASKVASKPSGASLLSDENGSPIDNLPLTPPRAPWLLPGDFNPPSNHRRSPSYQPENIKKSSMQFPLSSAASAHVALSPSAAAIADLAAGGGRVPPMALNRQSTSLGKNMLPPDRVPLTARMVSELNYASRRNTSTPRHDTADLPATGESVYLDHRENEHDLQQQLLAANYQRFAVEAQSNFEPDEYTDYSQTPMLNFKGILDRGILDYVHPGLVGELPSLWLPGKKSDAAQTSVSSVSQDSLPENDVARRLAVSVPQRMMRRIWKRRKIYSATASEEDSDAFLPSTFNVRPVELQEVYVADQRKGKEKEK